jgi:hypothetical protein
LEKPFKLDSLGPRLLHYRSHYKIYFVILLSFSGLILSLLGHRLSHQRWEAFYSENHFEVWFSFTYFLGFGIFYFGWLKSRLSHSVQVYATHLLLHNRGKVEELKFEDVEQVGIVCWSIFYLKLKSGLKYYFSSSLERVDYVWEGFHEARPDLISQEDFESFRTKLVQYDHHQKRKDWFFRHKIVDVLNWIVVPLAFLIITYFVQSRDVVIHQQGMYFFRLSMYSVLVLLITAFIFSIVLKRFVFDKRVTFQINSESDPKVRDLEFEGIVLHRSKLMQIVTASFVFSLIVRSEMNLFSLTKIKEDLTSFNLKSGHTLVVDNRFNCLFCKYPVRDGDIVVFGKGTIGQIMATEGDMVGQLTSDKKGRMIASENIQEVPKGHIAVKLANQKEMLIIKIDDLIGKIQK